MMRQYELVVSVKRYIPNADEALPLPGPARRNPAEEIKDKNSVERAQDTRPGALSALGFELRARQAPDYRPAWRLHRLLPSHSALAAAHYEKHEEDSSQNSENDLKYALVHIGLL